MIAWTIKAAQKSNIFNRILVSTDSEEIAEISSSFGAEVPFMRNTAQDDHSPVSEATLSALSQARQYWAEDYSIVVQLMPNCPLRDADDIIISFDNFLERNFSYQISCFRYGWMNPWWAHSLDGNGCPEPLFRDALQKRSQDLKSLYCPSGAIWIAAIQQLELDKTFYGKKHTFREIPWASAVDIDDFEDLEMAKVLYALRN